MASLHVQQMLDNYRTKYIPVGDQKKVNAAVERLEIIDQIVDDDLAVEESIKMFTVTGKSTVDLENDELVMESTDIKVDDTGKHCSLA